MLVERQFQREDAYSQQETYLKNQGTMELQRVMEELKPFPMQRNQRNDNGFLANGSRGHLTQIECYAIASSLSSLQTVHNRQSYSSGGSVSRGTRQPKSVCRSFTKMNHEVIAFGPSHAEHARRFYHSEGKKPELRKVEVPPYQRATYYSQRGFNNGSYVPGDRIFNTGANNSTTSYTMAPMGRVSFPKISGPAETVLKVAKISPKPKRMRPKTSSCVVVTVVNKNVDDGVTEKSDDFRSNRIEIDLENAPLFQILCEISKN